MLRAAFAKLRSKGLFYWLVVLVLIGAGTWIGHWLERRAFAIQQRYKLYQFVTQNLSSRQAYPERTVVVLIEDEEFWKGKLARRVPIKRDYLSELVRALDKADASAIALDFDLRSQTPNGDLVEHPDYQKETRDLLDSIKDVSKRRPVILPKTMGFEGGYYVAESDIYDHYDFQGGNVYTGYVVLPFDYRTVPLAVTLKDGTVLDSFAQAIVRATNERALEPLTGDEQVVYGSYLPEQNFPRLSSSQVLSPDADTLKKLHDSIVIVGAGWSSRAFKRGNRVDTRLTPVGPLVGAVHHANFVEALLDRRTSKPWGSAVVTTVEVLLSFAVAVLFALVTRPLPKLLALVLMCLALAAFGYVSWINLGLFYDFFVPVVLVVGHSIYEQIREWQAGAHAAHG